MRCCASGPGFVRQQLCRGVPHVIVLQRNYLGLTAPDSRAGLKCRSIGTNADVTAKTEEILNTTAWLLGRPDTQVTKVQLVGNNIPGPLDTAEFSVIRDDLLHPIAGSKLRKFDARFPALIEAGITDLITCGGLQSGHNAAFAAAAAEAGIRAHLLVRGEQPKIPSGFHLLSRMFGSVSYISRSEYCDRAAMFRKYTDLLQASLASDAKVAVVPEGAADAASLWGLIRLARYLAASHSLESIETTVVDSGTGTSAIGLALGAYLLNLPFRVLGVRLAGTREYYEEQTVNLCADFGEVYGIHVDPDTLPVTWVDRQRPRKFGKVFPGEIQACSQIARTHGLLLDPIYSLAAWEIAAALASAGQSNVAMLHAGGSLGLHGLAQRFPDDF